MVTVFQCVKELGIAYSPMVLSIIGNVVKRQMSVYYDHFTKVWQDEDGEWVMVNGYYDKDKNRVKSIILDYITGKRREDVLIESFYYKLEYSKYGFGKYCDTFLKRS